VSDDLRLPEIRVPRWAKLAIALPAIGLPVAILWFILRNEHAHDERRCPFTVVESRTLTADVVVVEERRSCVAGVEDRRYSARRDKESRVLGSRRLPPSAFQKPQYYWSADLKQGQVYMTVNVAGDHPQAKFREGTDEERAY
jgi:hypothetical protein